MPTVKNRANVLDVATYILRRTGAMSGLKLQKLVYYCQAWSLVWDERPLFSERIEAWANGPVVPALYQLHRLQLSVSAKEIGGDPDKLDADSRKTIDAVLKFYGDKSAQWLSELTYREQPWQSARKGLKPGERGSNVIKHVSMAEYYSALL